MNSAHSKHTGLVALGIVALVAGVFGTALPAAASAPAPATPAADRVLVTPTFPYPQATDRFQTQSPLVTGPDGALWFTHGLNDVVRMTTAGVYKRFAAYPSAGPTWVGSSLVRDDQGGFTYEVSVGDPDSPHVMHVSLDGVTSEIPLPAGVTQVEGLVAGNDGTVWYEGTLAPYSATTDLVVRISHGVARALTVPGRANTIVPTDDGGAWVSVRGSLTRIAPDGTVVSPPSVAGRIMSYVWPGTADSLWYVAGIAGDPSVRAGLVQPDGTVEEKTLGTNLSLMLPITRQPQRSATWINAELADRTQAVFAGTTPANLHLIPLPVASAQQPTGVESGGRLWLVDNSGVTDGRGTAHLLSVGLDGSVRDQADLVDSRVVVVGDEPDGTILMRGDAYEGGLTSDATQIVALHPDGSLVRGGLDWDTAYGVTLDPQGRPWFSTRTGISTLADATSDRLGGGDRYEAAVTIAKAAFPSGAPVIFVASGENFPDALSAGPLAAANHGPLLLTLGGGLPAATRAEIVALSPSKIVVVGGAAAVSDAVVAQLRHLAPTVQRVSGADRYAVSRGIVAANQHSGKPLFVATGMGFADAVTAGAAAARSGGQLLLVPGTWGGLPAGYASFIRGLRPSSIAVVGGPLAVSGGIVSELSGVATTTRYGGSDRYAVSAAILRAFGTPSTHVYLTTGQNFPDALAAAPLAGRSDATVATVPGGCVPDDTFHAIQDLQLSRVTLLGGPTAVGSNVAWLRTC
jgi:putative cell wall-binding protein